MSFKQRRDLVKEQSAGKSSNEKTQDNVDSLSTRRSAGSTLQRTLAKISQPVLSSLKDTRNKIKTSNENENQALNAHIEELEIEIKTNMASGESKASKKRQYLLGT